MPHHKAMHHMEKAKSSLAKHHDGDMKGLKKKVSAQNKKVKVEERNASKYHARKSMGLKAKPTSSPGRGQRIMTKMKVVKTSKKHFGR